MPDPANQQAQWFFANDPALQQRTKDGLTKVMQYVWALKDQTNASITNISNVNNSLTQQITEVQQTAAAAANAANNAAAQQLVVFGTHTARVASFAASAYSGYLYIETDRFQAAYYSNGTVWVLLEGTATGSFETRYTGMNSFDQGMFWIETSRNNVNAIPPYPTYRWSGANWNYEWGEFYRPQNGLTTLAGSFNSANSNQGNDVGALVNVTDFCGQLQWQNGNVWAFGPDDDESHGMGPIPREVDPVGTWWHLYDGSSGVTYLQGNGNVGTVTLPNISGANASGNTFLVGGIADSGINPASSPVFAGNAANGNVTGTFAGVGTGNSNAFTTANFTAGTVPALTGPNPVHVNSIVGGNITATFVGANVSGSISNNGAPQNIVRRVWFRR